jgi:hypothetical protein
MEFGIIIASLSLLETTDKLNVIMHSPQIRVNGKSRPNTCFKIGSSVEVVASSFQITNSCLMDRI